jgi:hypothetical protein
MTFKTKLLTKYQIVAMDPKKALEDAHDALLAGDYEECNEHLADYWDWRHKGGFQPPDGDKEAKWIAEENKGNKGGLAADPYEND